MDPIALLDASPLLRADLLMLRDMLLTAVGAIIGGRLGWLLHQHERRIQRAVANKRRAWAERGRGTRT